MDYEHFTLKTQDALQQASALAQQKDHSEIGLEHILDALLKQKDGIVLPLVERIGVPVETLLRENDAMLASYPTVRGNVQMSLSSEAQKTLAKAEKAMADMHDEYLSTEHIFLAMSESDGRTGDMLRKHGIDRKAILEAL